jgi:hypothetical protein
MQQDERERQREGEEKSSINCTLCHNMNECQRAYETNGSCYASRSMSSFSSSIDDWLIDWWMDGWMDRGNDPSERKQNLYSLWLLHRSFSFWLSIQLTLLLDWSVVVDVCAWSRKMICWCSRRYGWWRNRRGRGRMMNTPWSKTIWRRSSYHFEHTAGNDKQDMFDSVFTTQQLFWTIPWYTPRRRRRRRRAPARRQTSHPRALLRMAHVRRSWATLWMTIEINAWAQSDGRKCFSKKK